MVRRTSCALRGASDKRVSGPLTAPTHHTRALQHSIFRWEELTRGPRPFRHADSKSLAVSDATRRGSQTIYHICESGKQAYAEPGECPARDRRREPILFLPSAKISVYNSLSAAPRGESLMQPETPHRSHTARRRERYRGVSHMFSCFFDVSAVDNPPIPLIRLRCVSRRSRWAAVRCRRRGASRRNR